MRIGYLTSIYARPSHSFILGEVKALRGLGHEVVTFSVRRPQPAELVGEELQREDAATEYLLDRGLPGLVVEMGRWALRRPRRVLGCLRLAGRMGSPGLRGRAIQFVYLLEAALLARRLDDLGVEHLHDHFSEGSAAVALFASVLSGVPFSFTVHGPDEIDKAPLLALDEKVRGARFVAAITDYTRSQIFRWIEVEQWPKVQVIHCGVDPRFLSSPPAPPGGENLLSIGRLVEQKGQLLLLDALAAARREGVESRLVLIGDGPLRPLIERRIAELGLEDAVELRGWMDNREVGAEIDASRAVVLSSFAEGLPIVLMEAMGRGRPVIATRVGGIAELVRPGVNGWLVDASSVDQLSAAIAAVAAASGEELERMGEAGRVSVVERHDRAAEARKLAALMGSA
ncbi:MAG TPA: glycosyltransferase [Solirubrobacterales bacterium]|jgi:glycosyltransferase involved in cell wall biosynthesis|nr:glycosyltransferase [Solirubrobacterales bacterium]